MFYDQPNEQVRCSRRIAMVAPFPTTPTSSRTIGQPTEIVAPCRGT